MQLTPSLDTFISSDKQAPTQYLFLLHILAMSVACTTSL